MPPFPCFTLAVPAPSNFDGCSSSARAIAPAQPDDDTDEIVLNIRVPTALLDKLPRSTEGNLAAQFSGWPTFDATGELPCNYFRLRIGSPGNVVWVNPPFVDNAIGPSEAAFKSALRHFTPDPEGVAENFPWFSSYQGDTDGFCNPGFYNLTLHIFGADADGNLPPETAFTPPP